MKATAVANSNIAFVKYWGKKDSIQNIPMNPSISMTLDKALSTKTTVEFSDKYRQDDFFLNGKKEEGDKLKKVSDFLDIIRKQASISKKAKVVSENIFPTSAGIASSASGFAALAAAASKAAGLKLSKDELSALARRGSGSASRSIFGGFVEWQGEYASQLEDEVYWPQLRDIIVIVDQNEKKISSREAMKLTVEKSRSYRQRITKIPETLASVKKAIQEKDFSALAKEIMKDSESMHACIREIGIDYLNAASYKIKKRVEELNEDNVVAAYSFDAGPNAHIITLEKNLDKIREGLESISAIMIISKPGKGIIFEEEGLF